MDNQEIDSKYLSKLFKNFRDDFERDWKKWIKVGLAYIYLICSFSFFCLYFSYNVQIVDKPLSYFFLLARLVGLFVIFTIINHIIVQLAVNHKTLLLIELLTIVMLICIGVSDVWIENYHSIQY